IYALIETGDGVPYKGQETDSGKLWRSDDGGENWRLVSYDRRMGGRTHYYFRVEVSPDNENEVHFLTNPYGLSTDGGLSNGHFCDCSLKSSPTRRGLKRNDNSGPL